MLCNEKINIKSIQLQHGSDDCKTKTYSFARTYGPVTELMRGFMVYYRESNPCIRGDD